jgi:hypothetical protein
MMNDETIKEHIDRFEILSAVSHSSISTIEQLQKHLGGVEIARRHIIFCLNKTENFPSMSMDTALKEMKGKFEELKKEGLVSVDGPLPRSVLWSRLLKSGDFRWRHITVYSVDIDDYLERLDIFMVKGDAE